MALVAALALVILEVGHDVRPRVSRQYHCHGGSSEMTVCLLRTKYEANCIKMYLQQLSINLFRPLQCSTVYLEDSRGLHSAQHIFFQPCAVSLAFERFTSYKRYTYINCHTHQSQSSKF